MRPPERCRWLILPCHYWDTREQALSCCGYDEGMSYPSTIMQYQSPIEVQRPRTKVVPYHGTAETGL